MTSRRLAGLVHAVSHDNNSHENRAMNDDNIVDSHEPGIS